MTVLHANPTQQNLGSKFDWRRSFGLPAALLIAAAVAVALYVSYGSIDHTALQGGVLEWHGNSAATSSAIAN